MVSRFVDMPITKQQSMRPFEVSSSRNFEAGYFQFYGRERVALVFEFHLAFLGMCRKNFHGGSLDFRLDPSLLKYLRGAMGLEKWLCVVNGASRAYGGSRISKFTSASKIRLGARPNRFSLPSLLALKLAERVDEITRR